MLDNQALVAMLDKYTLDAIKIPKFNGWMSETKEREMCD